MNQIISKTDINLAVKNIKYMGQGFIFPGLSPFTKERLFSFSKTKLRVFALPQIIK